LQFDPKPGALFVGLQKHEAAKLVRLIREAGVDLTIIGGGLSGALLCLWKGLLEPGLDVA